jgi:hypothetical protein
MACFPIFTWTNPAAITGLQVRLGTTGAWTPVSASSANTVYGWGVVPPTTTAATASLAGVLRAALALLPGTVSAAYIVDEQGTVSPIRYSIIATTQRQVQFPNAATAELFGFTSLVVTFPDLTLVYPDINPGLTWAPCPRAFSFFARKRTMLAVSGSEMANVVPTVTGWGTISPAVFQASLVPSANIWLDFAQRTPFAAAAGRNVVDPNNLLENLAEAVGNNQAFRFHEGLDAGTMYYVTDPAFGDTAARCTPVDEPRYYMINLNARRAP